MPDIKSVLKGNNEQQRLSCKFELGQYLLESKKFKEAAEILDRLVKEDSQRVDYRIALADAHFGA